jgi:hypothetical protein
MMIETIILQVKRMFNNFAPEAAQKIREEKIHFLTHELRNYTDDQFRHAVDNILGDENIKRFPTLAQLKNHLRSSGNHQAQELQGCQSCEDSGYYVIWQLRREAWYSFAYRCNCEKGNSIPNVPLIDDRAIPTRAHNPYPPSNPLHKEYNLRPKVESAKVQHNERFGNLTEKLTVKGKP